MRRAQPFELSPVRSFVAENFSPSWADEISVGFARQPISVFIATIDRELVGFAAYECTRRGSLVQPELFKPRRVKASARRCCSPRSWSLREMGYVYAIIGAAGPVRFYQKTVGAIIIPDSEPGIYTDC